MTFEEQINLCADKVCSAIRDNQIVDLEEIRRVIKTNMSLTMESMFYSEDQALADQQMRLLRERDNEPKAYRRAQLNIKIQEIAQKRKAVRMKIGKMHDEHQLLLLKKFVTERFGNEVLTEFYALHPFKPTTKIKNP